MNLVQKWSSWAPYLRSVLRMVAAFMFILTGSMKLFAIPVGMPPSGAMVPWGSQMGVGGFLELVGGSLLLLGLFTRPTAFILSGEMAVAYFQFHFPKSFWPNVSGGIPAAIFSFLWLYFSAAGPGPWSFDAFLERARRTRA